MSTDDVMDNWSTDDKLNRKASADFLTNYLTQRYSIMRGRGVPDAFVLSVRADWGYGKTFFLSRWSRDLEGNGYPVVRFDAWANDYSDDPLVGFIASVNDGLASFLSKKQVSRDSLDGAISVGKKLIKPIAFGAAAVLVKQLTGMSVERVGQVIGVDVNDLSDDISDEVSSLLSRYADIALEEHRSKSETIGFFKEKLSELVEVLNVEAGVELPIFIFIDELDRCRPTYAIELLEAVKHLFGVAGIYFVVATNTDQLGHSIRAIYGGGFNSEAYLKRFFDQEYILPSPDGMHFIDFAFDKYGLTGFDRLICPIINREYRDYSDAKFVLLRVCDFFGLSLRDREQVAASLFAILSTWPKGEPVQFIYLIFLLAIKHASAQAFNSLTSGLIRDQSGFLAVVDPLKRGDFGFTVVDNSDAYRQGTEDKSLVEIFWSYYFISMLSMDDISEQRAGRGGGFHQNLCQIVMNGAPSWGRGEKSKLFDYPSRIRHAGQLL